MPKNPATTGIRLDIDDDGNSYVVEDIDKGQMCLANMKCVDATREIEGGLIRIICHFKDNQAKNVFTFEKCPANKWHKYIDVRHHNYTPLTTDKKKCFTCSGKTQWQLKKHEGNKNDNPWICMSCHPPTIFSDNQIETRKFKNK